MKQQALLWERQTQALVNQGLFRGEHLRERLEDLKSARFASADAANLLIKILSDLNNYLLEGIARAVKRVHPSRHLDVGRYRIYANTLRAYCFKIAFLYEFLVLLEGSRIHNRPPGIGDAVIELGRAMGLDDPILVCPNYKDKYAYRNLLIGDSEHALRGKELGPDIPASVFEVTRNGNKTQIDSFAILFYPLVLRDDTLSHVLLIHELAHLAIDRWPNLLNDPISVIDLTELEGPHEQLRGVMIEYVADCVATYLLGPAFLFALVEYGTSLSDIETSQRPSTHPPLRLRVRNIIESMKRYGQYRIGDEAVGKSERLGLVGRMVGELERFGQSSVKGAPGHIPAYGLLEEALNVARTTIMERLPGQLRFTVTSSLLLSVDEFVAAGIPPAADYETGRPANLGTILNAGWIYRVSECGIGDPFEHDDSSEEGSSNPRTRKLADLSRLVRAAVNQSEAIRRHERQSQDTRA